MVDLMFSFFFCININHQFFLVSNHFIVFIFNALNFLGSSRLAGVSKGSIDGTSSLGIPIGSALALLVCLLLSLAVLERVLDDMQSEEVWQPISCSGSFSS